MREEITEPKHWRTGSQLNSPRNNSWASRRARERAELAAEVVDAALEDDVFEPEEEKLDSTSIITSLASQLELLEKQREQIQRLLDQAQGS